MSFELVAKPCLWIPIQWPGLKASSEDGIAEPVVNEIEGYVELVSRKEFRELFGIQDDGTLGEAMDDIPLMTRLLKNWRKLTQDGHPVPFSPEMLAVMADVPGFAQGFGSAYNDAINGRVAAREGNSNGLPANGQADS